MDNIIFDNNIQVVVSQSPTSPADGDTVIFTAQPQVVFATGNRTELENYDFIYTWMVSYDSGLNYQKVYILKIAKTYYQKYAYKCLVKSP